jgi:hypothetical protein
MLVNVKEDIPMSVELKRSQTIRAEWKTTQVLIITIIAAIAAFVLGLYFRPDPLSAQIRRIAIDKEANSTVVAGKKDRLELVNIASAKSVPSCDRRASSQACKTDIEVVNNQPILVDREANP